MRKHLLAVLMVSFCVNSALSADLQKSDDRLLQKKQSEQEVLKTSFLRAKSAYFKTATPKAESGVPKKDTQRAKSTMHKVKDSVRRLLNKSGIKRNELPTAGETFYYGTDSSGLYPVFTFNTAEEMADSDGYVTYVRWDFGDGSVQEIPVEELDPYAFVSHIFPGPGTYNVSLKIFDDSDEFREFNETVTVVENIAPTPYFTQIKGTLNTMNFTAVANDPENSIAYYRWDFGDGSPRVETQATIISHDFPGPGSYWVRLTVRDTSGADNWFRKLVYIRQVMPTTVMPYPIVKSVPIVGNGPLTVNFDASLSVDSRERLLTIFEWDFGDFDSTDNNSKIATPSHTYRAPGTYFARLTVKDRYNNEVEQYFAIHVKSNNSAGPMVLARKFGNSRHIDFEGNRWSQRVPIDPGHVFWDFGDGTTGQGNFVQHQYPVDGKYTVRLVIHDIQGKRHVVLHDIQVSNGFDEPEVRMWAENDIQQVGETHNYIAEESQDPQQGEPLKYTWNFSDGTVLDNLTEPNMEHTYSERGAFPVSVIVTNSRGISNIEYTTVSAQQGTSLFPNIYYYPKIGNAPLRVNLKSDLAFSTNSSIVKNFYQFSDQTYATTPAAAKVYNDPGYYWVKLYVKDALGNEAVSFREIIVLDPNDVPGNNEAPVGYFKIEKYGPNPGDLRFNANGSFDPDNELKFFEWRLNNILMTDGWQFYPYLPEGTHSVRLTARDEWNANVSVTKTFKVGATNDAYLEFTFSPFEPAVGQAVEFNASSTVVTGVEYKKYKWDFGDGTTGSGEVDQHIFTSPGNFTVTISATDLDGVKHSESREIVVFGTGTK